MKKLLQWCGIVFVLGLCGLASTLVALPRLLHGEQDTAVPVEQAQVLYQKLLNASVQATLVTVENADHNFKPIGGAIKPTRAEISDRMGDFFDNVLK